MVDAGAGQDREPDYRMSLAAERADLAYVRTCIGMTAGGVAVASALPSAGALILRRALGIGLIARSAALIVFARTRFTAVSTP